MRPDDDRYPPEQDGLNAIHRALRAMQKEHLKALTEGEGYGLSTREMTEFLDSRLAYAELLRTLKQARRVVADLPLPAKSDRKRVYLDLLNRLDGVIEKAQKKAQHD